MNSSFHHLPQPYSPFYPHILSLLPPSLSPTFPSPCLSLSLYPLSSHTHPQCQPTPYCHSALTPPYPYPPQSVPLPITIPLHPVKHQIYSTHPTLHPSHPQPNLPIPTPISYPPPLTHIPSTSQPLPLNSTTTTLHCSLSQPSYPTLNLTPDTAVPLHSTLPLYRYPLHCP